LLRSQNAAVEDPVALVLLPYEHLHDLKLRFEVTLEAVTEVDG
jgi:hypothetical protein